MKDDLKNHSRDFTRYCIIIWVVSLVLFSIFLVCLQVAGNIADASGSAGSILQGTLGVAVAFAGAWVAIKIAATANLTVANQDRREFVKESTEAVEKVTADFLQVRSNFEQIWVQLNFLSHIIMKKGEEHSDFLSNVTKHRNAGDVKNLNLEIYTWIKNDVDVQHACCGLSSCCVKQSDTIVNVMGHINTRAVLDSLPVEYQLKPSQPGQVIDVFAQLPTSLSQASRKIDEVAYWLTVSALNIQQVPGSPVQEVTALEHRWTNMIWALGMALDHKSGAEWLLHVMSRFRYSPEDMKKALEEFIIAGGFNPEYYTKKLFDVPAARVALKSGRYMQSFDELITYILKHLK